MNNLSQNKILDKAIFVFIIIFLLTLTNSIFLNQIGYYGALVLILFKFYKTKQNPFEKTGLELALSLFIVAEIISAALSDYSAAAFTNVLKRILLLPVIYVIAYVIKDEKKLKIAIYTLLFASFVMIFIYVGISAKYFLQKLYSTEAKGPSLFKYVMTAGGLISFITILVFAFLINEKSNIKTRIIYFVLFLFSALALLGNYSRAAWLGAFMGLITVLILKRKWVIISIPLLLIIAYIFVERNISEINIFTIDGKNIKFEKKLETEGQAKSVVGLKNSFVISDHNKGIIVLKNNKVIQKIVPNLPVIKLVKWQDSVVAAYLSYSRFLLYKQSADTLALFDSLTTNGNIVNILGVDNKLVVVQNDSGLIVKNNPFNLKDENKYPQFNNFLNCAFSPNYFSFYDLDKNSIEIYKSSNYKIEKHLGSININTKIAAISQFDSLLFFQADNGLHIFLLKDENYKKLKYFKNVKGILSFLRFNGEMLGITNNGDVYKFITTPTIDMYLYEQKVTPLIYYDEGAVIYNDKLVTTYVKRNRILSIFDPYHNTNIQRLDQWKTGFRMFWDNPLFGVGDIDLNNLYTKYKANYEREKFGHLHNNYVHLLAILGLIGFISVMYLFYKVAAINLKVYNKTKSIPFISSVSLGVTAAFIGFLFSGLAEWNFGDHEIITFVWFLTGLNIACGKLTNLNKEEGNEK
jgi:hypothetical protein